MKIQNISPEFPVYFPPDWEYSSEQCIFFDIETTGLSWRCSHIYLLGAVFMENSQWVHRQWFCQRPSEEREVLEQFAQLLNSHKLLIHFNGNTFDVPYLMHKYTFYQMEQSWEHISHLDLYQQLLPYKKLLGMEHMRQKDLEILTGVRREDPFTGGELIACYQEYLQTGDERLYRTLSLHNLEDVEGLIRLLPLLSIPRLFRGELKLNIVSFILTDNNSNELSITAEFTDTFPLEMELKTPWYRLEINKTGCLATIFVFEGTMKYFFSNYRDYFYLPLEDEAIHKSVGIFVDKEHREKAKACNCYTKKKGRFLPQFKTVFTPEFYREYKDSPAWFELGTDFFEQPDNLRLYLNHLLWHARNYYRSKKD